MKKIIGLLFAIGFLYALARVDGVLAETVNPASAVTADTSNTAGTIVLRNSSDGSTAVGPLTATSVSVSSNTTGNSVAGIFIGAYSNAQVKVLAGTVGKVLLNVDLFDVCPATGPGLGAWVVSSTSPAAGGLVPCYP